MPLLLWGLHLRLWASWSWGIAKSHRKIVGDEYIYNGIHSSMSLTQSQWNYHRETFCCGKQHKLSLGRLGEPWVCECAPSVSLPYKSDQECKKRLISWQCAAQGDIWATMRKSVRLHKSVSRHSKKPRWEPANNITYSVLWKLLTCWGNYEDPPLSGNRK